MAEIVLGLGTSHTPMLLVDADDLPRYEENDRRLRLLDNSGVSTTFDALLHRVAERHAGAVTPASLSARHASARRAIQALADDLAGTALDALVIIGDDQQEMLKGENVPALMVYDGATIRSRRPEHAAGRPAWVLRGTDRFYPEAAVDYPVAQGLGRHIAGTLERQGFDVVTGDAAGAPMGHAYAFVHSQVMRGPPIPVVPVLLNALYPPNQPTPARCLEIGAAIADAVRRFPGTMRVGIVASGGLSHFVVDEALDREVVRAVAAGDEAALAELPVEKLNSGSAEIRNWICAAGALRGLRVDWIEYFPGYRTRAGTGTGLCFAVWR